MGIFCLSVGLSYVACFNRDSLRRGQPSLYKLGINRLILIYMSLFQDFIVAVNNELLMAVYTVVVTC